MLNFLIDSIPYLIWAVIIILGLAIFPPSGGGLTVVAIIWFIDRRLSKK
jgi:hypothetical protein